MDSLTDNTSLESLQFCRAYGPRLTGTPYVYHAYFAGNWCDDGCMLQDLWRGFTEADFLVYERDDKLSDSENIRRGMERSMKIFIVFTRNFAFFEYKDIILSAALARAEMVSPHDVIVLRDPSVTEESITGFGLNGVEKYRIIEMDVNGAYKNWIPHMVAEPPVLSYAMRPNLGWSLALCYYRGYLSIILPALKARLTKSGFMEGVELLDMMGQPKKLNINDRNMSYKFFIIIPESLKGLPKFNDLDDNITDIGKLVFKAARGGLPERDYSSYIHQIKVEQGSGDRKEYLFLGEIPAILINLYDLDCMTEMPFKITAGERLQVLQQFHAYLVDLVEKDENCRGRCSFIFQRAQTERISQPIRDLITTELIDEIDSEVKRDMVHYQRAAEGKEPREDVMPVAQQLETLKIVPTQWKVEYMRAPERFYNMFPSSGKTLGQVVIINNKTFNAGHLGDRRGAEQDEEDIVDLFRELNFKDSVYRDLRADEMTQIIAHFADDSQHEDGNAAAVVIMTHGLKGQLYGVDGEKVSIVQLMELVGHARTLLGKPKLFFIEACQMEDDDNATGSPSSDGAEPFMDPAPEKDKNLTPCAADVLASYATLPGKRAFRDRRTGTLYIQQLCKIVRRYRRGKNLIELLKIMSEKVQELAENDQPLTKGDIVPRQRPFYISSLNKSVALAE